MSRKEKPFKLDVVSVRLVKDAPLCSKAPITGPQDAVAVVGEHLCQMDREVLCVINLRTDGTPINCTFASTGSLNSSIAQPRELFKASILSNAASMILVHNHPSGSLRPSKQDSAITDRMIKLCAMMQIPLLDHIIVAGDNSQYFSFKEHNKMKVVQPLLETDYQQISFDNILIDDTTFIGEPKDVNYHVVPVKEKIVSIPSITVGAEVLFFEEERPKDYRLYHEQEAAAKDAWERILRDKTHVLQAAQFTVPGRFNQSVILHHSTREGVDWQLSFLDGNGEPVMHEEYFEDGSPMSDRDHSINALLSRLRNYSQHGNEISVTVQYKETEREAEKEPAPENIFEAETQVIVNPVNLVGVMGAGLAKQMKDRYPEMFEQYRKYCQDGTFKEGHLWLSKQADKWILNFPTKQHWRNPSDLALIETGLKTFVKTYEQQGITSITFPKLGCGLGGLDWESQVGPLMHKYLDNLPIQIEVCGEIFQERMSENMRPENVKERAEEPLKIEEITILSLINTERVPHMRTITHTLSCEVRGVQDVLTYEINLHDDDEESFSLHTEKDDIWNRLSHSELERLERIVAGEVNYQTWLNRVQNAKTTAELNEVRLFYMEMENTNLTAEQSERFWTAYEAREHELSSLSVFDLIARKTVENRVTEAMAIAGYSYESSDDSSIRFINDNDAVPLTFSSWGEAFDWLEYPGFNEEDYEMVGGLDIKDQTTRITLADEMPDPDVTITDMMRHGYMDEIYGNMLPMGAERAKQFLSLGAEIYLLNSDSTKRLVRGQTDPSFTVEHQMYGIFGSELERLKLKENVRLALKEAGHELSDNDMELGIEEYKAQNGGIYSTYNASDIAKFMVEKTSPAGKEDQEKVIVNVQAAAVSNYEDYDVVLAQFDRDGTGDDQTIYLGKSENYDSKGNYDNSDNSLMFVSANRKMFSFLDRSEGWTVSQQEMIDNGTFSKADYAEYQSHRNRLAKQGLKERHEKKFGINIDVPGSGVPFRYPDWNQPEPEKKEEQKQRLFVDMDGTLTVFQKQEDMSALYEQGYFKSLPPHESVIGAVRHIIENHPEIDVYILSAYLTDSEYALAEKNEWVDNYLPEIDAEHRIFVPNGSDKKEWVGGIRENDYLWDDYTHNLNQWFPGKGIKLLNAINHTHGTWQFDRVRFDRDPVSLAENVVAVMQGKEHVYDKKVERVEKARTLIDVLEERRDACYLTANTVNDDYLHLQWMMRADETREAIEILRSHANPAQRLEDRKEYCKRMADANMKAGAADASREWLIRWNELRRTIDLMEKMEQELNINAEKLAERIDNFMYDNDFYEYQDSNGTEVENHEKSKAQILSWLEQGDKEKLDEVLKTILTIRDGYLDAPRDPDNPYFLSEDIMEASELIRFLNQPERFVKEEPSKEELVMSEQVKNFIENLARYDFLHNTPEGFSNRILEHMPEWKDEYNRAFDRFLKENWFSNDEDKTSKLVVLQEQSGHLGDRHDPHEIIYHQTLTEQEVAQYRANPDRFLESVYAKMGNAGAQPSNYYGHSMSVGDAVVVYLSPTEELEGGTYCHNVWSYGFPREMNHDIIITDEQQRMASLGMTIREELEMLETLDHYARTSGDETLYDIVNEETMYRLDILRENHVLVFNLAAVREVAEREQDKLQVIAEWEDLHFDDHPLVYGSGPYSFDAEAVRAAMPDARLANGVYVYEDTRIIAGQRLQAEIDRRFEKAVQEFEQFNDTVYRFHASPKAMGEHREYDFFVQRYTRNEREAGLIPQNIVYVGTAKEAIRVTQFLNARTFSDFGGELELNTRHRSDLGEDVLMGAELIKDYATIREDNIRLQKLGNERSDKVLKAMKEAGYLFDEFESGDRLIYHGEYGTRMEFDSLHEAEEWLDGVVFDDPEISDRVERVMHPERFEAEFGADGTRAFPERYTFNELLDIAWDSGANLADVAIGRMMDQIEEETGKWPLWSDIAPQWVVDAVLRGGQSTHRDYDSMHSQEALQEKEKNMQTKEIVPIHEITDGNGRALAGDQILRAAVYNAVKEFQENNDLPDYLKVLDENGQYEDKDLLYSGYDDFVALSHMEELQPYAERLAPHVEAVKAARPDIQMHDEHILLPLLAEIHYGKQNGMTEEQIDFMLSKVDDRMTSDSLRNIRLGFEDGLSEREINLFAGEDYYVQEYLRVYMAGGGDIERAEALKGSDMNTAYFVLNAYREDGLSAKKGKGVVQAVTLIRNWNQQDVEDQRSRGVVYPDYRFRGFDLEWFSEYFTDLAKDDRVTPAVLSAVASGFVAQRETNSIQDFVKNYGGIEEFLAESAWKDRNYYQFFYADTQNEEAHAYQKETGYHMIWASDNQGMNGDTWIVYRSVEDLPAFLQEYAREEEQKEADKQAPRSFIVDYYVVENLQKQGPLDIHRFNDLDSALKAYGALPSDKMKALGITNSNPLPGSLDFIHCREGVDTLVEDYKKVNGWNNPEITAVVEKITEAVNNMKEERTMENSQKEESRMVKTNMGEMPIEDYRHIVAVQNGFDSYEDMYRQGGRIGYGYDIEPEAKSSNAREPFTESEKALLKNALAVMAVNENERNVTYEWGTPEKTRSNNKMDTIFALRGKTEFSTADMPILKNALNELAKAEQDRNRLYDWGTVEKERSNKMLEEIKELDTKVDSFKGAGVEQEQSVTDLSDAPADLKNEILKNAEELERREQERVVDPAEEIIAMAEAAAKEAKERETVVADPDEEIIRMAEEEAQKAKEKEAAEKAALASNSLNSREQLAEQLTNGVRSIMESEKFKNWLDTSSRMFCNSYSFNNAMLIYMQKNDATYTMGYDAWKDYGRNVAQGAQGLKIFVPVIAYEKAQGGLFRMIKSSLNNQLKSNSDLTVASYKVGMSKMEFTMNRNGLMGLKVAGKEACMFKNDQEVKNFISNNILGKTPMYFTVGTVFDVKDTITPDRLWVKKGFTKDELVRDENGEPIKNRKGEYQIYNSPERQAKFQTRLPGEKIEHNKEKMEVLFNALKAVSERNGVHVYMKDRQDDDTLKNGADGYFSREFSDENPKGYIVIPEDLDATTKCTVMIHEMAHSDLHGNLEKLAVEMGEKNVSRKMREVQAEATAYAVGKQFGLNTEMNHFAYISMYSQGFELQDFQKSLEVIYKECQKLSREIEAELDKSGLNLDLTEKPKEMLGKETIDTLCKDYLGFALENQDRIDQIAKELPDLATENREYPDLIRVIMDQKSCVDRQAEDVQLIKTCAQQLPAAETRAEQDDCMGKIEAAMTRITQETAEFSKCSESFMRISGEQKKGFKAEWDRNPLKTLEKLSGKYPALSELAPVQKQYIAKSKYIHQEYAQYLRSDPNKFVEAVCNRAKQLDNVISKNGMFVEIEKAEQWTDKPIAVSGTLCHPKVANTIVKEGERQTKKLRDAAAKTDTYVPYTKCQMSIYAVDNEGLFKKAGLSGNGLVALQTRVDIGDESQDDLTHHLKQVCGESHLFCAAFEKATKEIGAKEKIVIAQEKVKAPKVKGKNNNQPVKEAQSKEDWQREIQKEKARDGLTAAGDDKGPKEKNKSNKRNGKGGHEIE